MAKNVDQIAWYVFLITVFMIIYKCESESRQINYKYKVEEMKLKYGCDDDYMSKM